MWDLADDLAHAAPLPTSPLSSIGGFINHLRWVEHGWFEHSFVGGPIERRGPRTNLTASCRLVLRFRWCEALAGYAEQAAIIDAILAEQDLDDRAVWPLHDGGNHPTLRFVVLQ